MQRCTDPLPLFIIRVTDRLCRAGEALKLNRFDEFTVIRHKNIKNLSCQLERHILSLPVVPGAGVIRSGVQKDEHREGVEYARTDCANRSYVPVSRPGFVEKKCALGGGAPSCFRGHRE